MEAKSQNGSGWLPGDIWINIFEIFRLHGGQTDEEGMRHERTRLDTLLSISSTCKVFYHLVRPTLYRTLDFKIHRSSAGIARLIETLVEDPDVWQYVQQIRLAGYISPNSSPAIELGTRAAGEEKSKLLVHLEGLGVSPDLINDIVQDHLVPNSRGNVMVAVLLCLCRNVRAFDLGSLWRVALLRKIMAEGHRAPNINAPQTRQNLLLDRRPCAEIKSLRIERGKTIDIGDVVAFMELPSLLSLDISNIYSNFASHDRERDLQYKHLKTSPSWNLRSLKIEKCTMNACLVADVVKSCRMLRSLDIDVRHTPSRPAFRYDHLGDFMMRYNHNLEILICREYVPNNRVAFLDRRDDSLRSLVSLRTLALPLSILWTLQRRTTFPLADVLPTSLKELRILSFPLGRSLEAREVFTHAFMDLMRSQDCPELTCIKIEEHDAFARTISLESESIANGWKGGWDESTREYVYTRSTHSARQAGDATVGLSAGTD